MGSNLIDDQVRALPPEIQVWHSNDKLDHLGTWATTRYPAEAVPYVPKAALLQARADAAAAQALMLGRADLAVQAVSDHCETDGERLAITAAVDAIRRLALDAATLAAMTPTMQANFHRMMGQRGVLKKLAEEQSK